MKAALSAIPLISLGLESVGAQESEYIPFDPPVKPIIHSPEPYTYLSDLPESLDWRNVNGTNYCGKVLNQKNPSVCGSCWAHAATSALSDRYKIATENKFTSTLAPQNLINFKLRTTGGSCEGGDHIKAYDFIHQYGISDDNCMPYAGANWRHGFHVAALTEVEDVQNAMCHTCSWDGNCGFVPRSKFNLYGADEFGWVRGEEQMMAELSRGPIACSINSHPDEFKHYSGGIITCDDEEVCKGILTHIVVIAGYGVDKVTGLKYWVGRNSYGTQWGEGGGGGWFRLERGDNTLQIESGICSWAVPAAHDVQRVLDQYQEAL
eukprot:CAMPEP_0114426656 /NCGR_PEP_ID=MMETSP0103-20121206/7918_1 /TAXON_ID=37642 ORGANISM="Paraphysomonas imperforata, Strain PA2" /NCGR_SAMPLE_ID=MMETSP0103 /ASSEMBLY_ACC=CAM_ASM_000201 /LENGTH=320 /DNA_ID=CAMNT_0001595639 /DNA_START=32 /DNA_END=994 /DNA_ORIENTATION=+